MIALNEEKTIPYLQTSESKNMITMNCYEFYSYFISEIARTIDPNYVLSLKGEDLIDNISAPGLPIIPSNNNDSVPALGLSPRLDDGTAIDDILLECSNMPIKNYNQCILAVPPYFNKNHVMNIKSLFDKFSDSCIIINI